MKRTKKHSCVLALLGLLAVLLALLPVQTAQADGWYWISSNDKYSKFFDPVSVVTQSSVKTHHGEVPTRIDAVTKTTFSYGGAKETIANYRLGHRISNPANLGYSIATVSINPQNRTIQYLNETFFTPQGQPLWRSGEAGRIKEVNSQEFDEDFYTAILDQATGKDDETNRRTAKDRWLMLWEDAAADGQRTTMMADTTTMRMKDRNIVFWAWQETKNSNGQVLEIKFMKKAVNPAQGTERTINGKYWSPQTNWQALTGDMVSYRMVRATDPRYKGILHLRSYIENHRAWVNRYSLDD